MHNALNFCGIVTPDYSSSLGSFHFFFQLVCLRERYNFPLIVFCSGCSFLTMAAIFLTVSSFDSPVRLLLNFCNRSLLVIGFRARYLLTASSVIPWGPSSLPVGVGVLVLEPPPVPAEEGPEDIRGFLEAGPVSSPVVPFLAALVGRFLAFAKKHISGKCGWRLNCDDFSYKVDYSSRSDQADNQTYFDANLV